MKSLKFSILALLLIFGSTSIFAQETQKQQSINEGTINDQFEFVLKKSYNFRGTNGQMYENVKRSMFITLQAHTRDSINTLKTKLENTNTVVSTQQKEINDLKNNLTKTQDTLNATNTEKDSISLLGMQISKTNYNLLMWLVIIVLLALLLIFIYKFKNSNVVTKSAKTALSEVEEEFEEHRRTALEREQKVRRQLQDELNKQKG
jgi:tetrahydromethanopterin S-methyltransferase subunit B